MLFGHHENVKLMSSKNRETIYCLFQQSHRLKLQAARGHQRTASRAIKDVGREEIGAMPHLGMRTARSHTEKNWPQRPRRTREAKPGNTAW